MRQAGNNLQSKLVKVFLIQIILISLVTLAGVFAAKKTLEDVLVRAALEGEASYFWQRQQQDADFPLPDTMNLNAYMSRNGDMSQVPEQLRGLAPGYQRPFYQDHHPIVYVEDNGSNRLYLIFDEVKVSKLALVFGILPLAAVLVVLYILAWLAYRQSRKAVSPIIKLAKSVEEAELKEGQWLQLDLSELRKSRDVEVNSLITALDHFTTRLQDFIERERHFTRDASHELRTPIAVLRGAIELIERKYQGQADAELARIYRTLYDMEALIETLLLLSREETKAIPTTRVVINDVVANELDNLRLIYADKPITVSMDEAGILEMQAPERVVQILIGNLLRNAFNYTPEGQITVHINSDGVSVADSGIGMNEEQVKQVFTPFYRGNNDSQVNGYGLGMAIVKRLCNRYNWRLRVSSKMGQGTEMSIQFSGAKLRSA